MLGDAAILGKGGIMSSTDIDVTGVGIKKKRPEVFSGRKKRFGRLFAAVDFLIEFLERLTGLEGVVEGFLVLDGVA
jgi:hypothetical protein